jgi:hypothetical protein
LCKNGPVFHLLPETQQVRRLGLASHIVETKGASNVVQNSINRRTIVIARGCKLFLTFGGSNINPGFRQNSVLEFATSPSALRFEPPPAGAGDGSGLNLYSI